ncbi:MAG: DUF3102 domain-containing protein [Chroococcidiopsidaceae cyanobacterium CP_BM_ER_R8_30]|nr:DUF3102 domain-containing protein [Chroococcidiopsidaceae cyanobacterium CP_BM_ER_R8_30]
MPASVIRQNRKVFDYTNLDAEISQFVQARTGEIRALMKRTAEDIIEIGQKLIVVKQKLGHGCFLDWIEAEFEWSYPTAARFIQVANAFSKIYQIDKFAPSALYLLAAPSTPETAREEALALAKAGEHITYTTAKNIKQKHNPLPPMQPKSDQASQELVQTPKSAASAEIVKILQQQQLPTTLPQRSAGAAGGSAPFAAQEVAKKEISQAVTNLYMPQPFQSEQASSCWHLGTQHLLYCTNPNSPEFLQRLPEDLGLLLAFPPTLDWQPEIRAETSIVAARHLPQEKNVRLLEDTLESIILLYSELGEKVVICFLPFLEIISIVNRLGRCGIFVEPDSQRVHEIVSDWRASGLKAERVRL